MGGYVGPLTPPWRGRASMMSMDGFVARPNGELDWIFKSSSPDSRPSLVKTLGEADAHIS
jgi:hypothetical protein